MNEINEKNETNEINETNETDKNTECLYRENALIIRVYIPYLSVFKNRYII